VDELVHCVQADPSLTRRLLKLANAKYARPGQTFTTAVSAAAALHVRSVRELALGFTLVSGDRGGSCAAFDYERYWLTSLACAVSAQVLARWTRAADPAEAFTCGLLSRVGQLALASVHPKAYADVLTEWNDGSPEQLCLLESHAFEIDHDEVTISMMAECGLPERFSDAVFEHGQLDGNEPVGGEPLSPLSAILATAWRIAELFLVPGSEDEVVAWQGIEQRLQRMGIPAGDTDGARDEILADWSVWAVRLTSASTPSADRAPPLVTDQDPRDPRLGPQAIRILAVDDDPVTLRLLRRHLESEGYEVVTAVNGRDALQIALDTPPQIIVTDWMMPEMNGVDLCRALRRFEPGRRMYILILTGREDEEQIIEGFQAGADDYVSKPFNPRILMARVLAGQRMVELQGQSDRDRHARSEMARDLGLKKRQLQGAVWTDFLTALPNRRYAIERLEKEWRSSLRTGKPLAVAMVDIDNFKRVNDCYGHDVGDIVLRETARALRRVTRRGDQVCRLGGEEFLVINVNSDLASAVSCAERLRAGVERHVIDCPGFRGSVTISLGVAQLGPQMDVDLLLKVADQAVYEAKAAGRNTIRTSADLEERRTA
jgi:diguanylate cyclase (GGDEF)-like protein